MSKTFANKFDEMIDAFNNFRDLTALNLAQEIEFDDNIEHSNQAKRIIAAIYFQKGRYIESADYWQDLVCTSQRPEDWLSVVTSTTLAKQIEKGEQYFEQALALFNEKTRAGEISPKLQNSERISTAYLCHYYCHALCDVKATEKALKIFFKIGNIYKRIKTTDDTFLFIRGIPFFLEFIKLTEKLIGAGHAVFLIYDYLNSLVPHLDKNAQTLLNNLIKKKQSP
jgi:tetratricopeptide (TPR) repeat protein